MRIGTLCRAAFALGMIMLATTPAPTQDKGRLPALRLLQPGQWQVREIGAGNRPHSYCIADPAILLQVEHRRSSCSRLVIESGPRRATVHYTCGNEGFGRTTIRVESGGLARIETQGIIGKRPFEYRAEARRTGACR